MKKCFFLILFTTCFTFSQQTDFNSFINDATFFCDKYISTTSNAAVYQSSSAWMSSAKKRKRWDVTLGLNTNLFFIPQNDKTFQLSNSDFLFLKIENQNSINAETALGGTNVNYLVGNLGIEFQPGNVTTIPIRIETPQGINQNVIIYPYLQAAVAIGYGTELAVKYSTKTKLKKGDYQVYGFGLKHNLSQYFKALQNIKVHLAAMASFSREEVNFEFLNVTIPYIGSIGINEISSNVFTKQFQINVSKEYKKCEVMAGIIINNSNFKYEFSGSESQNITGVKDILNEKIKDIAKNKTSIMGELSIRYNFKKIYIQPVVAFGRFVNTNFSVQYEF